LNEATSQRLFFALWPDDAPRAAIAQVVTGALEFDADAAGRPVPERNLHATLVFLGQVAADRFAEVIAAATSVSASSFELRLDRVQVWEEAGVLVLTARQPPLEFGTLVERLRKSLRNNGFTVDSRPAQLHVTLARKIIAVQPVPLEAPIEWTAREFVLVRSDTLPTGSEYTVLRRWPLV
jgi:2'-5' RNA ligase